MKTSRAGLAFVWLATMAALVPRADGAQATFPSPAEAAKALVAAVEAGNLPLFLSIAGDSMVGFWNTDDPVRDTVERDRFLDAARVRGITVDHAVPHQIMLYLGGIAQPFPAP